MTPPDSGGHGAADLAVLDLLYADGDGGAVGAVDDAQRAELESFQNVRSLFSELEMEEPPQAVSAKLLQAAAEAAPKAAAVAESAGVFGRIKSWFGAIAMHPGLAAAASLVLVVGIAGTLYYTGRTTVSEPEPPSDVVAVVTNDSPGAAAETSSGEKLVAQQDDSSAVTSLAQADPAPDEAVALTGDQKGAPAKAKRPKGAARNEEVRRKRKKESKARDYRAELKGKAAGGQWSKEGAKKDVPVLGGSTASGSVGGAGDGATVDTSKVPDPSPAPPAKPVPESERITSDDADDDAPSTAKRPAQKPSVTTRGVKSEPSLASLRNKARSAAKRGDCSQARKVGAQVRKRDSRYYDTVFLRDSVIATCYRVKK